MRRIRDEYELSDGDDDEPYARRLRPRPRSAAPLGVLIALVAILAAAVAGVAYVQANEPDDRSCTSCHTIPHTTYQQRGQFAQGGALAVDLSSYHYQALRLQGQAMHCIDCHRGDGGPAHLVDKYVISARNLGRWLAGEDDRRIEKGELRVPHLANETCVACHAATLLVGGQTNHHHNMLPAAYRLWKAGSRLSAPADAADPQALIAAGLKAYDTTVQCADCHASHRQIESDLYLIQAALDAACEQCHRQTGGPISIAPAPPAAARPNPSTP